MAVQNEVSYHFQFNDMGLRQHPRHLPTPSAKKNHRKVSMKYRFDMDRRAENNVPSAEMPVRVDTTR